MTTNSQVAHLWAAHNMGTTDKSSARSANGNFSFADRRIYSYRTCLAEFRTAPSGERYVIHNTCTYSQTTSGKHQPALRRSLDYGRMVRTIDFDGGEHIFGIAPDKLVSALLDECEAQRAKAKRSRKYAHLHAGDAAEALAHAQWLAEANGLPWEGIQEFRERIEREHQGALAWAGFVRAINEVASIGPQLYDNAMQSLGDIAAGVQWLATGERGHFLGTYAGLRGYHSRANGYRRERPYELPTLLRVNGDTVETSRGAEFPLADGLKALPFIERAMREERAYDFTPRLDGLSHGRPRLGHFAIDNVSAAGWVRAGCHTVPGFAVRFAAMQAGKCLKGSHDCADLENVMQHVRALSVS